MAVIVRSFFSLKKKKTESHSTASATFELVALFLSFLSARITDESVCPGREAFLPMDLVQQHHPQSLSCSEIHTRTLVH